jgi:hypothetical protein
MHVRAKLATCLLRMHTTSYQPEPEPRALSRVYPAERSWLAIEKVLLLSL